MPQLSRTSTASMTLTSLSLLVILSVTSLAGANTVTKVQGATDSVGMTATSGPDFSTTGSVITIQATAARTRGDISSLFIVAQFFSNGQPQARYGVQTTSETGLDQLFTIQGQAQKFKLSATLQNADVTSNAPPSLAISADLTWTCSAGQTTRGCGGQTIFSNLGTTMTHVHGQGDDCFDAVVSGPVVLNGVPYTVAPQSFGRFNLKQSFMLIQRPNK